MNCKFIIRELLLCKQSRIRFDLSLAVGLCPVGPIVLESRSEIECTCRVQLMPDSIQSGEILKHHHLFRLLLDVSISACIIYDIVRGMNPDRGISTFNS